MHWVVVEQHFEKKYFLKIHKNWQKFALKKDTHFKLLSIAYTWRKMKKVEKNWKTFFGLELLYSSRQAFWCIESGGTEVFS